ncbi:THAP domain-containing protein 6-like [Coccinella septempunctata]|uniref:THAP domain-containing protein 6-like n=1 Tax=Coccinella septempunctata TaxID=41139 RepID=UPI001D07EA5F|nr:THAP domain-containing protein 6-like [Coccinella septempunctata]
MAYCSVKKCRNNTKFPPAKNISFHTFPKEEQTLKEWLQILGIPVEAWKWTKNSVVCSEHFRKEDYLNGKRLMYKAVPSLKMNIPINSSICSSAPSTSRLDDSLLDTSANEESHTSTVMRHTRKTGNMSQNAASSSPSTTFSSDSKEKIIAMVESLHNYSISPSKLMNRNIELKKCQASYRRKLYNARKTIKSLRNKIQQMKEVMDFLRQDQRIS